MQFTFSSKAFLRVRHLLVFALGLLPCLAPMLYAQDQPAPGDMPLPPVTRAFAITNARIVQSPGHIIEHGTVVMRNGLITAVGTDVQVPFDAEVIKGDSLTVYAGFIDGLSHAGIVKPGKEPPVHVARPGEPPNNVAGIQPERDVRTLLQPTDPSVEALRKAGFAVTQTVPYGVMLPGSGAIVLLGGDTPQKMVLRGDASLYARFTSSDDVYPSTPMGVMAKWRDLYREALRQKRTGSIYAQDPSGIERPQYDPSLQAFNSVIDGKKPVAFETESNLEVHRAIKLSKELGFPLMVVGLKEGWDVAPELKENRIPVFLSLDLPTDKKDSAAAGQKDSVSKAHDSLSAVHADTTQKTSSPRPSNDFFVNDQRTFTWADIQGEKAQLESRQKELRRRYYESANQLHNNGVRFGLSSGETKPEDIRTNIRLLVENGLPEDAALAALTTDGAKLLGMENSLGTVERGKMANLLVTSGSYFDKKSQVRYMFVDGKEYKYDALPIPKDSAQKKDTLAHAPHDTLHNRAWLTPQRASNSHGDVLIKNGTLLTITDGTKEKTDILVRDGKIAKIGQNLEAPRGVPAIDATGKYVMPGIIDAHSHIAVSGGVNEATNPITPEVAIADVLNPYDISIYRALAGGKTIAHVMHGSANVIGGQCQTIKMRYGVSNPDDLIMEGAPRTIKFALGENPTRVHGRGYGVQPSTRMGVEMTIRKAFSEAQRYMKAQDKYQADKGNSRAIPPAYSLRMETLADILRGNIIINCHSYRADEILMLMRVLKDYGVKRIVFQHVNEGFKVAPELAAFGAGASVFADWWAYKVEVYYSTAYNAAILTRNGVVTSINSDSPELDRHLNHEASKTQKYGGLTPDEALKLITINPAKQLGIDSHVGSLEVGKDADIAIFNAHPLSIYGVCEKTIVDGVVRFDRENDPDDMRILFDPKLPIDASTIWSNADDNDFCMQGTRKLLGLQK